MTAMLKGHESIRRLKETIHDSYVERTWVNKTTHGNNTWQLCWKDNKQTKHNHTALAAYHIPRFNCHNCQLELFLYIKN